MKNNATANLYKQYYSEIKFERAGLFEFIQQHYACTTVLYPGCFIHITPSFHFPHVVYVDTDQTASIFFTNRADVMQFIDRHKHYRRSAYIEFLPQDYKETLPFVNGQFDLLISLYAGGIARSCKEYLKIGGFLLTNNFHNDAEDAVHDGEFELISVIRRKQSAYGFVPTDSKQFMNSLKKKDTAKYVKQTSGGFEYTEPDDYYILKRTRPKA